ncbi:MAG TPA: hypothetical protein V6C81_07835 [Planktothrix sp.]|jgi:hypothetical protein
MTTTTPTKVTTKWDSKKIAETTSHLVAGTWLAAFEVLSKLDKKAVEEFHKLTTQHKLSFYKNLNIKTPMELVRAIAEHDHNLFGSEIEISGDENKATLKYNTCGVWQASEKLGAKNFSPEQQKLMGDQCAQSWNTIAKEFGFNFEPKMTQDSYEMTFSK